MARNRSKRPRRRSHRPENALEHAKSLLNRMNLGILWKVSARLSLHDMYTAPDDPAFAMPLLNPEKIRLLDQVILASRADFDRDRIPDTETLRLVLNDCKDMSDNPVARARLMRASGTADAHLAFQLFLAQIANVQFPGQEPRPLERAGRVIGLLEVLPERERVKIPADQESMIRELSPRLGDFLGMAISTFARCFLLLMKWQGLAATRSRQVLAHAVGNLINVQDTNERAHLVVTELFHPDAALNSYLIFTLSRLIGYLGDLSRATEMRSELERFMSIFSASSPELRRIGAELPEFQVGHLSSRLSPLERFPVVRIEDQDEEDSFIVPNAAHLLKSFAPVIDYTLLGRFGSLYSRVRGFLLELYLRCLIEDRLPNLLVIPEKTYGREERRGADLTLIDRELRRLILVEIKGRRIKLTTRLTMGEDELRDNLTSAHEALLKLPQKVRDLYAGLPEYQEYQEVINSTRGSEPICVAVLSEGVYFMGELVRELATREADPLYDYPYPNCVFALEIFERGVEVARKTGRPLAELLHEHWERSLRREYHGASPDSFGGEHIEEGETFAASFTPPGDLVWLQSTS
jgi:hypothetical protein